MGGCEGSRSSGSLAQAEGRGRGEEGRGRGGEGRGQGPVRYRKTKTEGLASKIAKVTQRKSNIEGAKKKHSIVDSLSNLFKSSKL